jgi:hypothetical protein
MVKTSVNFAYWDKDAAATWTGAHIFSSTVTLNGKTTFSDQLVHASAKAETKTANYTLDEEDVGKVMQCATDAVVFTLPSTVVGYVYTIVNTAADGAAKISVSPATADKIMGMDITDADNKDIINTKATAKKGDMIKLLGDGSLGWYIIDVHGTWAREA